MLPQGGNESARQRDLYTCRPGSRCFWPSPLFSVPLRRRTPIRRHVLAFLHHDEGEAFSVECGQTFLSRKREISFSRHNFLVARASSFDAPRDCLNSDKESYFRRRRLHFHMPLPTRVGRAPTFIHISKDAAADIRRQLAGSPRFHFTCRRYGVRSHGRRCSIIDGHAAHLRRRLLLMPCR